MKLYRITIFIFCLQIFLFVCGHTNAQQSSLHDVCSHDLSCLWQTNYQKNTLGIIGDNYQRLYIHLTRIKKVDDTRYEVWGLSKVRDIKCSFHGFFTVIDCEIMESYSHLELEELKRNDPEVWERCKYPTFRIKTEWKIVESPTQRGAGTFHGTMITDVYKKNKKFYYNDLEFKVSDSFSNNLFVGNWTSLRTKKSKKCCWGDFRIPQCGDLDIGAAEFIPNRKYLSFGWESYYDAYVLHNEKAMAIEQEEWWQSR